MKTQTTTRTKKRGGARDNAGRPCRYASPAVPRTLHLPASFWDILDGLDGSRSEAFVEALRDDALVAKLRAAL